MNRIRRLAITPGDPAGIGPDLVLRLAQQPHDSQLVVVADPELLAARAQRLRLALQIQTFDPHVPRFCAVPGQLSILPVALRQPVTPGQLDPANAAYVLETRQVPVMAVWMARSTVWSQARFTRA